MCVEVCRTRHQAEQLAAQRACQALKLTASGELSCVNVYLLVLGSSNWLMLVDTWCVYENTGITFSDASGDSRQGMLVLAVVCVNVYIRT